MSRWNADSESGLTDLEILNLLGQVLRWTAFVKKNSSPGPTLPPATAAASSTPQPPPSYDQECLFGLWLNREREGLRRGYDVLRAVREALGGGPIGEEYFDAIFDDPAEAQAMHALHASRFRAEA